jgi:23S rRNA (adenine-N6)-dimethyltransferase
VAVRRRPAREASGSHFLRSKRLAADLATGAGLAAGALAVEIGGGSGVLTDALARTGAEVIAIERDPALAARLRARFEALPSVRIVQADATTYGWPHEPFVVVANLPFVRSGAILDRLLRDPRVPLRGAHVIVQWELAAKHASVWPATLRSTYWRAWHEISIARRLHRSAFAPPPSVDCAVLCIERRAQPRVPLDAHDAYWRFLSAAFKARDPIRRGLRASLSPLEVKRLAPALGFAPDARPWEIDAGQWASLFAFARQR